MSGPVELLLDGAIVAQFALGIALFVWAWRTILRGKKH
jgi:hypothetical protein